MVDEYNGLNSQVVSAESLGSLKKRLDKFIDVDDRWKRSEGELCAIQDCHVSSRWLPAPTITFFCSSDISKYSAEVKNAVKPEHPHGSRLKGCSVPYSVEGRS